MLKVQSDWRDLDPIPLKAVLRFVWTTIGGPCVITSGMLLMRMWPADNWDSPDTVSLCVPYILILLL